MGKMKSGNHIFKEAAAGAPDCLGFRGSHRGGHTALLLPVSINDGPGVSFIDALFTSTSAVCVTGLIAIDTAEHFTVFGRTVVALLIQIGGLGVTSVGVGFILIAGKRVGMKGRTLVKEAMNVGNSKGLIRLVKICTVDDTVF